MLYIFDSAEKLITTLPKGSFFDAVHREVLNGENTFQFTISANSEHSEYVVEGNLVAFRDLDSYWQVFEVKRIVDVHGDGLTRTAYCEHIFYELLDDIVTDRRPSADATAALAGMLDGTRWQVGIVDDLGASSTSAYYESALSAVQKVANAWKGELNWRCVIQGEAITRYVDLLAMRGTDTGKQFVYSKDILSIEREVDTSGVVTALYGRGKGVETESGAYGRRLTFADVEAPGKPLGQEWIGDNDALARWGRPGGRHRFDVFIDEEETDPVKLLEKTKAELDRRKVPRVTYRLDVVSLEELTGYEHEKVRLGDMVRVIDREFKPELVVSARVIEIERDILDPANTKVVLGSFAPTIVEATINTARRVNEMANKPYNTKWLDGKISVLQNAIENTQSYVFQTPEDGILILDAPTYDQATKAMKLGGGIFAIANQKDGLGGWNWRTFGDGSGFSADLITAGMIDAGMVQIGSATNFEEGFLPLMLQVQGITPGTGADQNCTALYHFDGSLAPSIGPNLTFTRNSPAYLSDGTQVAEGVPRYENCRFGKGYFAEKGTTNLCPNPSVETNLDGWVGSYQCTIERDNTYARYGEWSAKITTGTPGANFFAEIGGSDRISVSDNTQYALSCDVRPYAVHSIAVCLQVIFWKADNSYNGEANATGWSATGSGVWERLSGTFTTPADTAFVEIRLRGSITTGDGVIVHVDGVQLEQRSSASSFVEGTRAPEVLKIPTSGVFQKGNWSIHLLFKPIVAPQGQDTIWQLFIDSSNFYTLIFESPANHLLLWVASNGAYYFIEYPNQLEVGSTYQIVATGDGTNLCLYINGEQIGEVPYVEPVGTLPEYMYIGSNASGTLQADGVYDELRIDKVARTDEEIAAWYAANAPFWVKADLDALPGYLKLETDGIKVYDPNDALRVLLGSWLSGAIRKYGLKIIDGEIYSSKIQTGQEGDAMYIALEPPNKLVVYSPQTEGSLIPAKMFELVAHHFAERAGMTWYDGNGQYYGTFSGEALNHEMWLQAPFGKLYLHGAYGVDCWNGINVSGGTKNCVEDTIYGKLAISARESPEVRYVDEGMGTLVNGECRIDVDPLFLECIEPNTPDSRWYIKLTPYADVGLYVAYIGDTYFVVKERNGGTSTGAEFTWSLSATRKDYAMIRFMEVLD